MPGWESMAEQIALEQRQLIEEGVEAGAAHAAAEEARRRLANGDDEHRVWEVFADLPRRKDYSYVEPSDLEGIRTQRTGGDDRFDLRLDEAQLLDRLHGAWLARCIGCALGKPVEGFMDEHNGLSSKDRIRVYLTAISADEYPIRDYFPDHSPAEDRVGKVWCPASTRQHIAFMETDDDIRYTILGQCVLHAHGPDFHSAHVVQAWLEKLTYSQVCTAETQAYRNIIMRYDGFRHVRSPQRAAELDATTDWHWVTNHVNPYREWIGAQIRCDSYGYAAPGWPRKAAELAWRDARISHVKNGIYGSMFCAAMIAAAFAIDDPLAIVETGLSQIPHRCRLHEDIRTTIALCREADFRFERFEQVLDRIYEKLGHYHPVHANNNAAIVVAALLLGGQDVERVITLAVMGGWDSDCNGATAGSIVGAMRGASHVPARWSDPLHDTLHSAVVGYDPIAISECARRSSLVMAR